MGRIYILGCSEYEAVRLLNVVSFLRKRTVVAKVASKFVDDVLTGCHFFLNIESSISGRRVGLVGGNHFACIDISPPDLSDRAVAILVTGPVVGLRIVINRLSAKALEIDRDDDGGLIL